MTKLNAVLASKLVVGQRCALCGRIYETEGGHKEAERVSDEEYEQYVQQQIAGETQLVTLPNHEQVTKVTKAPTAKAKRTGDVFLDRKQLKMAREMSTKDIIEMLK